MTNKKINLSAVFEAILTANYPNKDTELTVIRFLDKLADSSKFAQQTQREFNQLKLNEVHRLQDKIKNHEDFISQTGFGFVWNGTAYDIYITDDKYCRQMFLPQIDERIARKIVKDCNVAFLIKSSRE